MIALGVDAENLALAPAAAAWLGDVLPYQGTPPAQAEALLIRSTLRLDDALLGRLPRLRLVATASSGTDHVDTDALARRGIAFGAAPGANAEAVADWVQLALERLEVGPATVGVIGVGHVGRAVAARLGPLGHRLLLCDPPRAGREPGFPHRSLDDLLAQADVLTLHVPLDPSTRDLLDAAALQRFGGHVVLNAARGHVLNEPAARAWRQGGAGRRLALDVFAGEPNPDPATLAAADFVTPHVAGHTTEAKTEAVRRAIAWLATQLGRDPADMPPTPPPVVPGDPSAILAAADAALRAGQPFKEVRAASVRPPL